MRKIKQRRQNGNKEAITANTVVYSNSIKHSKSLYVESDVTENSHDAKGITVIYCKGNV